jgi:choline dehydrogenase-like flavoprotein
MSTERFDVVVVGSGAGGGVVAGELSQAGRSVLLLETGPHRTAADFTRWESHASADIWWPMRFAMPASDMTQPAVPIICGRCVGGTSTINTKVALRATQHEFDKWHAFAGLELGPEDMAPFYERVEQQLGIRERADWTPSLHMIAKGFEAIGADLEPVFSYTDENCMKCGSCLQGCPTNAGKSTLNTYIHREWAVGRLELRAGCFVDRVLVDSGEATGVEYTDADGASHTVAAGAVVVAAGALNTPQVLWRSGLTNPQIGRNLGFHPASFVFGYFDEPQDAHRVYPISAHCLENQRDEDGGFIIEALTVQDPIGFSVSVCDESGVPLWGKALNEACRGYRHWVGLLLMVNDDNNGWIELDDAGNERIFTDFQPHELERAQAAYEKGREILLAAGARSILRSGTSSTHIQNGCAMGADPARSVVDSHGESHDVKRLFVGDASAMPRTLSVNPSLTIMALATRLAAYIDADERGYLAPKTAAVPA